MSGSARTRATAQAAEIGRVLSSLSRRLSTAGSGGAALAAVAQAATYHVQGARWASVSLTGPERFRTLVATAPMAARADALQQSVGQGPAVDPAPEGAVHLITDLAGDRRWPVLSARAVQHLGVTSLLTYRLPLPEEPGTSVGLSLYSDAPDPFDATALWTGAVLASHAVIAVSTGRHRRRTQHLEQALAAAREVGTAAGVLMARYGPRREEAVDMLRATAQGTHRDLAEVAAEVIDTEIHRLPPMPAGPGTSRERPEPRATS